MLFLQIPFEKLKLLKIVYAHMRKIMQSYENIKITQLATHNFLLLDKF